MSIGRNKLYLLVFIACVGGYLWLAFNIQHEKKQIDGIEACLFKRVTNMPCPSCGSTRAILSLTNGNFANVLDTNPIGFILAFILLIVPLWIIIDFISRKDSFFRLYQRMEKVLKKPQFAIPLVLLIVINWIWNISKGL